MTHCQAFTSYHEDEEDEEDKGSEVDWSKDRVGFLNLRKLKISQNNPELGKTRWEKVKGKKHLIIISYIIS